MKSIKIGLDFKAELKDGKVILTWPQVQYEDIAGYVIYKNRRKTAVVNENIFVDEKVKPGHSISYEVSSIDSDKLESPKSNQINVEIPKDKK